MGKIFNKKNNLIRNNYSWDGDYRSDLNVRINNTYYGKYGTSELKQVLLKEIPILPEMEIVLECIEFNKQVERLELTYAYPDTTREIEKDIDKKINEIVSKYFKQKGFPKLNATTQEEMIELIDRIAQDVPYIKECFTITD